MTGVKTLKAVTIIYMRFSYNWYLSPDNKARSLSTLMAVIVMKDTKCNTEPASSVY